ncbi:MAG: hypothetical protein ACON5A_00625 [Candidatus Comchoanobacterales bacterium]
MLKKIVYTNASLKAMGNSMLQMLMIILLVAMMVVLGFAFKALMTPANQDPERLARLLLLRIVIGLSLLAILFICAYMGWIPLSQSLIKTD